MTINELRKLTEIAASDKWSLSLESVPIGDTGDYEGVACVRDSSGRLVVDRFGGLDEDEAELQFIVDAREALATNVVRLLDDANAIDADLSLLRAELDAAGVPPCDGQPVTARVRWLLDELERRNDNTNRLRAALLHFGSMTASCLVSNTPAWMELLAVELSKVCEVIGDPDRWVFDGEGLRKAVQP